MMQLGMDVALSRAQLECGKRVSRNFQIHTFKRRLDMLWTILVILLVLWLVGLLAHIGGGLIHLLLVIAAIVLIINLLTGRRAV